MSSGREVTIRFQGGIGKTCLHRLFFNVLKDRGFKIVDWDTETDDGDWLIVDTDNTAALVEKAR
jgi:hypothetical protein